MSLKGNKLFWYETKEMSNGQRNIKLTHNQRNQQIEINFPVHILSTYKFQTYKKKIEAHCEIGENREYGGNLPKKYFHTNFSCPQET